MSIFIHGIAASENIDSTGEVISIAGMDISTLAIDGVYNWEHKSDQPDQIVGKVLKAKKIFSEKDCADEHEAYFWSKCQTPFLYVMGELFDDYKDSAKEVAGMFRYDADKKGQNERNVMSFSIEGAKMEKQGMNITRSIARKVTITALPANKAAIAEMVPVKAKSNKMDADSLFKTESIEIELFKPSEEFKSMKKASTHEQGMPAVAGGEEPKAPSAPASPATHGSEIGTTKSGQKIFSHASVHHYMGMKAADHHEAAGFHQAAAGKTKDPKIADHHVNKMKLHTQAARTAEFKAGRFQRGLNDQAAANAAKRKLGKSLDAGSGMAAPSQLTGGAALVSETVMKPKKKKSDLYVRAEQEYETWGKKEEFRKYMQKKLPTLALGEIDAIGKTIALKKSMEAETALAKMAGLNKALTFGSAEDQAAVAAANEERKKNPPKKAEPKKKAPQLKSAVESEVSHVEPYDHTGKYENIHLKSGHELHAHPAGKFKVGDKVVAKPHLMGTHLLEHKKD